MNIIDIIVKKKNKETLTYDEIKYAVDNFISGEVKDYQMSSLLMAIVLNGMSEEEIFNLTKIMLDSGDKIDLSKINGIKVDKHSTGGVGDKTTLVVGPLAAACGVPIAKMSGKGLGFTGGTIDKLESIEGFNTNISEERFINQVNDIGISLVSQSGNLVPADKKIYALRDVTATVDSIPLIAASIMSKKIASGCDAILLDVKTGSGAFMKTTEDAIELAEKMVAIGKEVNKKTVALITNMEQPLGKAIGNSLEVIEVVETLKGNGPKDLTDICISLAGNMLYLAGKGTIEECENMAVDKIKSGAALKKLIEMVKAQGGDENYIINTSNFEKAKYSCKVISQQSGYVNTINAEMCGEASRVLGAGRKTKCDSIDYLAGVICNVKIGEYVNNGDVIAELHTSKKETIDEAKKLILESMVFSAEKPIKKELIYSRVF